jgi:hypothetical protein
MPALLYGRQAFRAFFNVKTILTVGIALGKKDFNIS